MKNISKTLLIGLMSLIGENNCFAEVPGFLEVEIGARYPLEVDWSLGGSDLRPVEQFRAPNRGQYSDLLPEYEVSILRENNQVEIITAERAMEDLRTCTKASEQLRGQLAKKFSALEWSQEQQIFWSSSSNAFYKVTCTRNGVSPFWELHYQARGKEQDKLLKSAWSKFLSGSR